jgi:chromosome segregation ATPase
MRRMLVSVSLALLLIGTFATSMIARQARQEPDVLGALLVEVRGLRAAMEQLGSAGPRIQLAMGRLQLNEQRITTFMRMLEDVRDRRIAAGQAVRERQKKVVELQEALTQGFASTAWAAKEMKDLQADLADANATLLRLQNQETKLTQDIATEQDRWAEINRTLEELDRALTRR